MSCEQGKFPSKSTLRLEKGKDKTYWSEQLAHWRTQKDPSADSLVAKHLGTREAGRNNYNRLMQSVSYIIGDTGRLLVQRRKLWKEYSEAGNEELVDYFMPMPAPAWVDAEKLARASRLWSTYTIPMMGVLYAASLPACYLIFRGIPALYASAKLTDANYLTQRLYETGLMLEAVLDQGGLTIIREAGLDAEGNPLAGKPGDESGRYLWGKGYMTAKKVRFLHAAMRYMLLNPSAFPVSAIPEGMSKPFGEALMESTSWDSVGLGEPVNQEDLAYTLLTFGLLIPKGLRRWGVALDKEDAEAFLHLWNVVGYIMGVEERLLTDDLEEAQFLFDLVQERQAGPSEEGKALTKALIDLLQYYLPRVPGVPDNALPVELIRSQIGDRYAEYVVPPDSLKAAKAIWRWPIYKCLDLGAKFYFLVRGTLVKRLPLWGGLTTGLLHDAGEGVLEAWRSAYRRQPFFVPSDLSTWQRQQGATDRFLTDLRDWRGKVLLRAALGIMMLVLGMGLLNLALPLLLFQATHMLGVLCLGLAAADWLLFATMVKRSLRQVLDERPQLPSSAS
jgi:hypothetical protein